MEIKHILALHLIHCIKMRVSRSGIVFSCFLLFPAISMIKDRYQHFVRRRRSHTHTLQKRINTKQFSSLVKFFNF